MINLRKTKWLLCGIYCPPSQSEGHYLKNNGDDLIFFCQKYDKSLRAANDVELEELESNL